MRSIKTISFIFLCSLIILAGCSTQQSVNPFDSRNTVLTEPSADTIPVYSVSRAVDSKSDEAEEHVNFKWGEHKGELKFLEISIEYFDEFYNDSEGYPVFYIGVPMRYRITIKNTGNRNFGHLEVIAIQEYHENKICDRWWYPYPRTVEVKKGDPMPGDSVQVWEEIYLGPNSEIVLEDTYTAPWQTCDGLDQTHVLIKHYNNGVLHAAVMYDNPELGVYCPPPPD